MIRKIFKKIGEQKVEKVLGVTFLLIFIFMIFWIKFLGAIDVGIEIEKDGFCKTNFGEDWNYNSIEKVCFNGETKTFTEQEFRKVCPKNKFISKQFFSNCWKAGDSK